MSKKISKKNEEKMKLYLSKVEEEKKKVKKSK
jgi:hypothetical protein